MCGVSLLLAALALGACGGGTSRRDVAQRGFATAPSPDPVGEPNAVVVQVGGHAITRAMFAHALAAAVKSEGPNFVAPVPPDFAACVHHMEAASVPTPSSGSSPKVAELKSKCQQQYQTLEKQGLEPLILGQWVIGGAAEAGVHVNAIGTV